MDRDTLLFLFAVLATSVSFGFMDSAHAAGMPVVSNGQVYHQDAAQNGTVLSVTPKLHYVPMNVVADQPYNSGSGLGTMLGFGGYGYGYQQSGYKTSSTTVVVYEVLVSLDNGDMVTLTRQMPDVKAGDRVRVLQSSRK